MTAIYPWIKTLHLLAVVAWIGGMLAVPTLLAAHAAGGPDAAGFARAARLLLKRLVLPGMITALVLGVALIGMQPSIMKGQGFMHAKLTLALVLMGAHGFLAARARKAEAGEPGPSAGAWGGVAAVLLALSGAVVGLVVVRPF
jgi:protoporphyrinogen IX oxidase